MAACWKTAYRDPQSARRAMRAVLWRKDATRRREGTPNVYRCPFCALWHWGHQVRLPRP